MINTVTLKIKRLHNTMLAWLVLGLLAACGGGTGGHVDGGVASPRHVFLIVMENQSYDAAISGQFTASLAAKYGLASNYHAITHPSVPNYLALTSGSTWGVRDDGYYALPKQDLGTQLTNAGVSWRAYMEGLGDAGCLNSPVPTTEARAPPTWCRSPTSPATSPATRRGSRGSRPTDATTPTTARSRSATSGFRS